MPLHKDEALAYELQQQENDAQYASKLNQELHDEDLARQLARAEERALAAEERAQGPPPGRPCTRSRIISWLVPILIISVGIVALIMAASGDDTAVDVPNLGDFNNPGDFFDEEDVWEGLDPGTVVKWQNNGLGLRLVILDALDSEWENVFHTSVDEWNSGTPDALDLITEKVTRDPDCESVDNRLKVCNNDYGPTKWRGINQVLISRSYIIASTSKMNDYYLDGSNNAQKQYTMCHEIGHGFGLPHSDEDFFNADLGTCMDYTNNPTANKSPDQSNFDFLVDLYGEFKDRLRKLTRRSLPNTEITIPDSVRSRLKEVVPVLENRMDGKEHEDGWKLLHRSLRGESHEMDLGDGWTVQVHKLLHTEDLE